MARPTHSNEAPVFAFHTLMAPGSSFRSGADAGAMVVVRRADGE